MVRWRSLIVLSLLCSCATSAGFTQETKKTGNPVAIGTPAGHAGQKAGGTVGEKLTPRQVEAIQKVNLYFRQLTGLKGTFVQTSADGKRLRGKFYVKRPGRFRFDYARPSLLVVVSDGKSVAIQDHDLGTDDRWGLEQTPFYMLLRADVDLVRDARFFEVLDSQDSITVSLQDKEADASGRIRLVFAKKPILELSEWTAKDAQGFDTRVMVSDLAKTEELDPALFNPAAGAIHRQR